MLKANLKNRWKILTTVFLILLMYMGVFYIEIQERGYYQKIELLFLFCIAMFLLLVLLIPDKIVTDYLTPYMRLAIKKRYFIGTLIFAILVLFQISGSSMNLLDAYTGEATNGENASKILLGSPQAIRSDEWIVNTEYHMAQVFSDQPFSVINDSLGEDGQNMLLACNSPVLHISLLGKPQTWGYILLGADRGIAWFWWFRFFALLLGAFEMGQILTNKNNKLSVFLAAMIGLSPAMTWWYSTTIVDLLIASQWLFIGFYYFMFQEENRKKIKFACLVVMSAIAFCIALYPAIQVPIGYLLLILMLYYLIHKRKDIIWDKKTTGIAVIGVALILIVLGCFFKDTYSDILKVMNTAYPGKREISTGQGSLATICYYIISCLLPFRDVTFSNNSEVSMIILFIPAVITLLIYYFWKKNRVQENDNRLVAILAIYGCFLISMYLISYPAAFLKITLFSFTMVSRNIIVVGIIALYIIVLILSQLPQGMENTNRVLRLGIAAITFAVYYMAVIKFGGQSYVSNKLIIVCCLVFVMFEQLIISNRQQEMLLAALVTVVISSMCVNPIIVSANSITDSELVQDVKQINQQETGNWLVLNSMVLQNVLAANGIEVVNAVQYEPNLSYWEKIDPDQQYSDIYNRYAHVTVNLTHNQTTSFEIIQADYIQVNLAKEDLEKAEINYIVTAEKLGEDMSDICQEVKQSKNSRCYIYKVIEE